MKQVLKLTLWILLLPMAMQAQDRTSIDKIEAIAQNLYLKENYKKCVEVLQKQKDLVVKYLTEKDTAYFANLRFQARCYYRMKDYDMARNIAKEALDNWEQNHSTEERSYILMLDNYATYLGNGDNPDYELALKYGKDAMERYEKLQKNDFDLAVIALHLAENSYYAEKFADAVKYEIRGIQYFKTMFGEHSDEYVGELEYLAKYYDSNGQGKKAQEARDLLQKLWKEKKDGIEDLPPLIEFKTTEECKAHQDDTMKMIDYYLSHLLSAKQMADASGYIMRWSSVTDLVTINIGEEESTLFNEKYYPYAVAYIAACCEYAIAKESADFTKDLFSHGIKRMLNFYLGGNKELTGEVPYLEKFSKVVDNKDDKALESLIDKYYNKIMKQIEKSGTPMGKS